MRRPRLAVIAVLTLAAQAPSRAEPPAVSTAAVRIGYFHGGRANLLYRTYTHGCFEAAGVKVDLYSRPFLRAKEFARIPPDAWLEEMGAGKATGVEIVDRIASGEFDGGAIGEASFLDALQRGRPVVAVARLGHQSAGRPGFALILRTGVKIRRPEDFKGKTLISRRSGPMDEALLREFVRQQGLDPDKDLKLLPQVDGDDATSFLLEGKADGGLYHVLKVKKLVERRAAYIYRIMDWVDPEMMQALLVFNPDFLKRYPDKVQKIVDAYAGRVALERSMPEDKRSGSSLKGLIMAGDYQGLSIPTYDLPPRIRLQSLRQAAQLLRGTGALKEIPAFEKYVDNEFVERSAGASAVRCPAHPRLPFQNALVIGWAGERGERLRDLLAQGKLPNLSRIISQGMLADVGAMSQGADAKAGWAAVPERLKARFGDGIETIFLSGSKAVESYGITKDRVDRFADGLGATDRVGARILDSLHSLTAKRFFLLAQFGDSAEALPELDAALGRIAQDLQDRKLGEQTLIYVVSETFLATNDPAFARDKADPRDIAPTLLDRFGVDLRAVKPPLNGRSLLDGD